MGLDSRAWDTVRDEIKRRLSPDALLRQLGVKLEKAGSGYKMPHHGEKSASAHLYADHFHCFGCGERGDVFDLWVEHRGGDQGEALVALAQQTGVRLPELTPEAKEKAKRVAKVRDLVKLITDAAHAELCQEGSAAGGVALAWLLSRGIRRETAVDAGLGVLGGYDWCTQLIAAKGEGGAEAGLRAGLLRRRERDGGLYDALHHTVTFPVTRGGKVATLVGRTHSGLLPDDRRKAKTLKLTTDPDVAPDAPEVPGLWWPAPATGDQVLVVEGEIDALSIAQAGLEVAGLLSAGAARDERTGRDLVHGRPGRTIYMAPDHDAAGRKAAADLAAQLGDRLRIVEPWSSLEGVKDPNDALMHHVAAAGGDVVAATAVLRAELLRAVEVAPLWIAWETGKLVAEHGGDPARLSAAVRRVVLPALVAVTDPLVRGALTDELATATGLGRRAIGQACKAVEADIERDKRAAEAKAAGVAAVRADDPDPRRRPFELGDHTDLATRLLEILEADTPVPGVYDRGDLYLYDGAGGVWRPVVAPVAMAVLDGFSGMPVVKRKDEETGDVEYEPLKMTDPAVRGAWAAVTRARWSSGFFDAAPAGIAFPNGHLTVSDAGAVQFGPHSPEHRTTVLAACEWDEDVVGERWIRFLEQVWAGCSDVEQRIQSVHEFTGLALLGMSTRYAKALVIPGPKAGNGKSSFQSVLSAMFPPEARTAIPPQDWSKEAFLAALAPSRWNVVGELPSDNIMHADRFNAVVTGDPVTANPKYRHAFTFRPRAAHIFACNNLPGSDNDNEGFWRRLIVIEFPNTFREGQAGFVRDIDKLIIAEELPAVYASCIHAAAALIARRGTRQDSITVPDSSRESVEDWRLERDTFRQWLNDCCDLDPGTGSGTGQDYRTPVDTAWNSYRNWANECGIRNRFTKVSFGQKFGRQGLNICDAGKERDENGKRRSVRYYKLRLKIRVVAQPTFAERSGSGRWE